MNIIKRIINRLLFEYNSCTAKNEWCTVNNGYHKDIRLYGKFKINHMWKEMCSGDYDGFLYDVINANGSFTGKTIWDVGAHIGYHTMGFSKVVGSSGTVVAFEPNPFNCERLKIHLDENFKATSNVKLLNFALSDVNDKTKFNFSNDVDGGRSSGGFLSGMTPPLAKANYNSFVQMEVETKKGDCVVADGLSPAPDVIKIDVEGAESVVLSGCEKILIENHPLLLIEVHTIVQMFEVTKFLIKLNYTIQLLDNDECCAARCFISAIYKNNN